MAAVDLSAIRREFVAGENELIPYEYHYSERSIKTSDDSLIRIFEIQGVLFETADNEEINAWHEQLCRALLSVGIHAANVAVWHWLIKENDHYQGDSPFEQSFAADFLQEYTAQINETRFYRTRQFLAVCIKSPFRLLKRRLATEKREEALQEIEEKLDEIASELHTLQHGIMPLSLYRDEGKVFSAPLEVLFRVLNGYWERVPLYTAPVKNWLATSRFLAGFDAFELRSPDRQYYGACLAFRQYMNPTDPCMLQNLLRLSFPLTLCQSFSYQDPNKSMRDLQRQHRQMKLSRNAPESTIDAMGGAIDRLKSNRILFGGHHFSLFVYISGTRSEDARALKRQLTDRVSIAKQILSQTGVIVAREDRALPSAYYAQLPGNFAYRPRISNIHTRNLASFIPMHTTPTGSEHSHWKNRADEADALLAFKSSSSGLYRFNPHIGDLGHTLIIGTSGAGKTVLMGALASQFDKYGARIIVFDKDSGQEILIRALNGAYHTIKKGQPSGLNPYRLPPTPANLAFLTNFTLRLAYPNGDYTPNDENALAEHLKNWYAHSDLPPHLRRLSQLRNGLQNQELKDRLVKWTSGAYGWLFDNASDSLDLMEYPFIGIDTTEILDDTIAKPAFFMYLTHRVVEALDGRRSVIALDEMWKMLDDPYFAEMIKDWLKTLRKKNAMLIGATQDAADVAASAISSTLLTQCQTRIFYANPLAKEQDYAPFSLTRNEFSFIKTENPNHRRLLIKQENSSVIVHFDLSAMQQQLAVLSGRTKNIQIARACIEQAGNNPGDWLPLFYQRYTME